jgi:hypothetical protein
MPSRLMQDSGEGWGERGEGNPFLRALFARSWFLVIPLLGVWWFEAKKIDPMAKQIDAKIVEERKAVEASRGKLLAQARQMGVRISLLRAVGDTFTVRFGQMGVLLDSLRILEEVDRKEIAGLEAQSESLRTVFSDAEGRSRIHSDQLAGLQATVDSLRGVIAQREEETQRLEGEIATDKDLADRVLRPDAYRKNNALLTGEGDFPNRDALPKR